MAKNQKAPPGVAQLSEKEFSELLSKRNPKSSTLNNVLEKLAAQNNNVKASSVEFAGVKPEQESKVKTIEKNVAKQEESNKLRETASVNQKILKTNDDAIKGDKKLLEVEKKLTSTIEKLVAAIQKSSGLGTGPVSPSSRAQELADSRKIDYRTFGDRVKDKIYGQGGNKFDPNSLKYKFGTLRGLAETTGLVKRGSNSAFESMLARREEQMQTAESVSKLRGEDTEKGRAYYLGKAKESTAAKRELQLAEEQLNIHRQAGLSDEEIQATKEGKKLFQARDLAAGKVLSTDPKMKSEKAGLLATSGEKSIRFAGPSSSADISEEEAEFTRTAGEQTDLLRKIEKNTRKGGVKAGLDEAGNNEAGNKGAIGGLMDTLGNLALGASGARMLGGAKGGIAKGASKLAGGAKAGVAKGVGGIGQFAAKHAGKLKVGGGVLAGGLAAYEGYSGYQEASEAEQAGIITGDEADIKKTGAVTGAAGGLSGAAAGAMAGSLAGPIGTVVGAAIGGIAGSKLGKSIGEWGASTWKNLTGKGDKAIQTPQDQQKPIQENYQADLKGITQEQIENHPNYKKYLAEGKKLGDTDDEAADYAQNLVYKDMAKSASSGKNFEISGQVDSNAYKNHPNYKKHLEEHLSKAKTPLSKDIAYNKARMQTQADMLEEQKGISQSSNLVSSDPTKHPNYQKHLDNQLKLASDKPWSQDAAHKMAAELTRADMRKEQTGINASAPKVEPKPKKSAFNNSGFATADANYFNSWGKKKSQDKQPKVDKSSKTDDFVDDEPDLSGPNPTAAQLKAYKAQKKKDQASGKIEMSMAADSGFSEDEIYATMYKADHAKKETFQEKFQRLRKQAEAEAAPNDSADKVAQASAQNDSMKYNTNKQGDQTLVNAPTNINKVTQTSVNKRPARSPDWYENRHRYKGMVPNVSF
jgi:hypothetical protein